MKLSAKELRDRTKVRVGLKEDDHTKFNHIFGEPVQVDSDGKCFVIIPAHDILKQYVRELHPDWSLGEDFVDMYDTEPLQDQSTIVTPQTVTVDDIPDIK